MATRASDDICPRCGGLLTITESGTSRTAECERCGSKSVELRAASGRATAGGGAVTLEITRSFWERHPRWFAAQLACYLMSLAVGVAGLTIGTTVVAATGLAVSAIRGGIGFLLPPWRDRIIKRKIIRYTRSPSGTSRVPVRSIQATAGSAFVRLVLRVTNVDCGWPRE
jgi:hypothetical protein